MNYEYEATVERVVDGDTIDCDVDLGFKMHAKLRFRLLGIDTPETHGVKKESEEYAEGMKATEWLKNKIEGKAVRLKTHKDSRGKYGRWLAVVFTDGININEELVRQGLAERY